MNPYLKVLGTVDNVDQIESSIAAIQKSIGWDAMDLRIASRRLRNPNDIKILASSQTGLIGYAILVRKENDNFYISQIAVNKSHQGQGVGKSIMRTIFEEAMRHQAIAVTLETDGEDEGLLTFYRKSGTSDFNAQTEATGKDRFGKTKVGVTSINLSAFDAIAALEEASFGNFSREVNRKLRGTKLTIETASEFYFRIKRLTGYSFNSEQLQNLFFDHVSIGFLGSTPEKQFELAKKNNQTFALARHYLRLQYQEACQIVYKQWKQLDLNKEQRYALYDEMGIYRGAVCLFNVIDPRERIYLCKKMLLQSGFDHLEEIIAHKGLEGITVSERFEIIQKNFKEESHPCAWKLAKNIKELGLKSLPLDTRVALCKAILKNDIAIEYCKELCEFALDELTSEQRMAFFDEVFTNENALTLIEHIEKFGLEDISLELRIKIYQSIYGKGPNGYYALNRSHEKWRFEKEIAKIADVNERVANIKRIVKINAATWNRFAENAELLNLHEATLTDRFDLCNLLHSPSIFKPLGFLQELKNLPSIRHKLDYCNQIIESAGYVSEGIFDYSEEIGLPQASEDDLVEIWRKLAFSVKGNPTKALANLGKFGFKREETRLALCKEAFARLRHLFMLITGENCIPSMGLSDERMLILLAQDFLQRGQPKDLDDEKVLMGIQSDVTKRQMYLELLRPPSTMKDEATSNFTSVFPEPVNSILPIIKIQEGATLDKEELELFITFVKTTPKLRVLVPFLEEILKKDAYLQCVLLEWIAYTAGVLYDLSNERILAIEKLGVIKDIYQHHNRANRFIFTNLLRYQEFYPEIKLSQSWGRLAVGLVSIFERGTAIELLSMIENTKFKDPKRFHPLAHLLNEISTSGTTYSQTELHLIATKIKTVLTLKRKNKAKKGTERQKRVIEIISETFDSFHNILKIFGKSEFLRCLELEMNPQAFFLDNFQTLFTVEDTENFEEQYQNTFAKFRNPMALYTYLRSINSLPEGERSSMLRGYNAYVNAVLQGTFPEIRYNTDQSEHVKKVFSALVKKDWINSAETLKFEIKKSEIIQDYRKFFVEKIKRDHHINPKFLPRLMAYLNDQPPSLVESNEELEIFQNLAIQLCEKKISAKEFVQTVGKMKIIGIQFGEDLGALTPKLSEGTYFISETDDACDTLLIGKEIQGSCQRVDGVPHLNKGLLSYLMNGEIRAIVVKKEGKTVARSIIRLLWDIEKNKPVILLERIYSNYQDKKIEDMIIKWAQNKAKAMKLSLVTVEVEADKRSLYKGAISFLGGYAPFTYCDALRGIKAGRFTIPRVFEILE